MDEIRMRLGAISEDDFEQLCCELLPREFPKYGGIEPGYNAHGKTTKGTPDAHVRLPDGLYVAFQFTTQQKGVREKVIGDIRKLNSQQCHFRDKISEVCICINTSLGSEEELYHQEAAKHGWIVNILSLEAVSRRVSKHSDLCSHYLRTKVSTQAPPEIVKERLFDCGNRMKEAREDVELTIAEFIEHIEYPSEAAFRAIEEQRSECPDSVIQQTSLFTGISEEWLKSGKGRKYQPLSDLTLHNPAADLQFLQDLSPRGIYFCIELKRYLITIIAQLTEYRWVVIEVGASMDFWRWIDGRPYIPRIYKLIDALYKTFTEETIGKSRILPTAVYDQVTSGKIHPRCVIKNNVKVGMHWADDIRDIHHHYTHIAKYYKRDYGEWFIKAQEEFRKYCDVEPGPTGYGPKSDA